MADLSAVPEDEREHPAYTSFVVATANARLTHREVLMIWSFYKVGWIDGRRDGAASSGLYPEGG